MKRILVTRPREQANEFVENLRVAGFEPICFPVIEIRPMDDTYSLEQALKNINKYEWIVFTSVNGVGVVFERYARLLLANDLKVKFAAIGPKTADALKMRGVTPDFVPDEYVAESILLGLGDLKNKWVLLPRAEIARKALPEAIVAAGGIAHEIAVYRTLPAMPNEHGLAALKEGVDWITFTSPSTVQNFIEIVRQQKMNPFQLNGNPKIACIGPITARAAKEEGFEVASAAEEYTAEGLVEAITSMEKI